MTGPSRFAPHDCLPTAIENRGFANRLKVCTFGFRIAVYWYALLILVLGRFALCAAPAEGTEPGLAVEFDQDGKKDRLVLPHAALYVETNQAAGLFLDPQPFTAQFSGWISVELRAQYTFSAEGSSALDLLINGKEVLTVTNGTAAPQVSKPVRLNKGTNSFLLRLHPVTNGPAAFRLLWASRNNPVPVPIPSAAFTHIPNNDLQRSVAAHNGAFLVRNYRCTNCHPAGHITDAALVQDAPNFDRIGSRFHPDWLAQWILNPSANSSNRPARMPQLFRGPGADAQAKAIAAYLASIKNGSLAPMLAQNDSLRTEGETLFLDLRCASCHSLPGESTMPGRISLNHVAQKFVSLPEFLQNPQAHYPVNPMPNFKLSSAEANALAAFLLHRTPAPKDAAIDANLITTGKSLVQSTGCLNCHSADLPNQFQAPPFSTITQSNLESGCLDPNSTKAPRFAFAPSEKENIKAFLATRLPSALDRNVPHENAIHYTERLQCTQCHRDSGMPEPLTLGGKLKPEWAARFIGGEVPYKPRPWLKTRMPAFPAYGKPLADGLAALHGHPANTPAEPPPNSELVTVGAKLVSSAGGFSCVACHPVKDAATAVVVESPGVNLAYSGERLLSPFFHRWLMNPIAIDPATKMPVYFDAEGRSQLTEFFDGDARKQIDAIWQYLRMGDKMLAPPTP